MDEISFEEQYIPHEEDDLKRRHKDLSPEEFNILSRSQIPPPFKEVMKFVNKLIIRKKP